MTPQNRFLAAFALYGYTSLPFVKGLALLGATNSAVIGQERSVKSFLARACLLTAWLLITAQLDSPSPSLTHHPLMFMSMLMFDDYFEDY